jgi:hypothetical protein
MQGFLKRVAQAEPPPPWRLEAVLFSWIGAVGVMIGAQIVVGIWLGLDASGNPTAIGQMLGRVLGCLVVVMFLWWWRREEADRAALRIDTAANVPPFPLLMLLGFGAAATVDVLTFTLTGTFLPPLEVRAVLADRSLVMWLLTAAFLMAFQPAAEAFLFRGVVYPVARLWFGGEAASTNRPLSAGGGVASVAVTALIYALFHWLVYSPSNAQTFVAVWYGLVAPWLLGLVLVTARAVLGNTRATIFMQMGMGLFVLSKLLLLPTAG